MFGDGQKETNINLPKTEEDLKNFIGWSFLWDESGKKTGMWGYDGRLWKIIKLELGEVWFRDQNSGVNHVKDVGILLKRIGEGSWVLVSPEGYLLDPQYNRTYNKKIIKEEINSLQWIMDEDPTEMIFQSGDRVTVHNVGNEENYIEWLGMYGDDYINGNYGEKITGEVGGDDGWDEPTEFYLIEDNTGDHIYFPYKFKMGDNNLKLFYELLNTKY